MFIRHIINMCKNWDTFPHYTHEAVPKECPIDPAHWTERNIRNMLDRILKEHGLNFNHTLAKDPYASLML